jgi:hypothetical protein
MDRLAHDVRIALRGFRRTPVFTTAVLGVLGHREPGVRDAAESGRRRREIR